MSSYEDNLNSGQRSIKLLSLYAIRFCSILWEVVACNEVFRVIPFTPFVLLYLITMKYIVKNFTSSPYVRSLLFVFKQLRGIKN